MQRLVWQGVNAHKIGEPARLRNRPRAGSGACLGNPGGTAYAPPRAAGRASGEAKLAMGWRNEGVDTLRGGWMRGLTSAAAGLAALIGAGTAWADDLMGQPTPGGYDLQPAASVLKAHAIWFHNWILMPIITAIAILILALLSICIIRFNRRANPTPARWSH